MTRPLAFGPAVCARCGYGVEVRRVALLEDGRVKLELKLCGRCRLRLQEAVAP